MNPKWAIIKGKWLFQVKEVVDETRKTVVLCLYGYKPTISIRKKHAAGTLFSRKPRWW